MRSDSVTLRRRAARVACALVALLGVAAAPPQIQKLQQDEDFAAAVKQWTTRPEFLSPLVDHLPQVAGDPVAEGRAGLSRRRAEEADLLRRHPEATTARWRRSRPRVKVMTIGKTDEGRECVVVAVASEETIKNLEQYRTYLGQLADPRDAHRGAGAGRSSPRPSRSTT